MATPLGRLVAELAKNLVGDDVAAQNSIIPILIELLPDIFEIVFRICNPTTDRIVRRINTARFNIYARRFQGRDIWRHLGGNQFGRDVADFCFNKENEQLIRDAIKERRPPVWGILA